MIYIVNPTSAVIRLFPAFLRNYVQNLGLVCIRILPFLEILLYFFTFIHTFSPRANNPIYLLHL